MSTEKYLSFFNDFMNESDRAALVLGAAQIDEILLEILKKRLIHVRKELYDFNSALGTFSSRIDMCCATGVISKEFCNRLHLIRKIRNDCAHNIQSVNLNADEISQQIKELEKLYSKETFWNENLKEAQSLYKSSSNSVVLRLAIALLVANLFMVLEKTDKISSDNAQKIFVSKGHNK